jgi:hypothetical protein
MDHMGIDQGLKLFFEASIVIPILGMLLSLPFAMRDRVKDYHPPL